MRCLPEVNTDLDEPFWLSKSAFYQHFDQKDFICRDVIDVTPSYLSSWFQNLESGALKFELPIVQIISGKTQFINGRHRTAVLLPHLDMLPFAFSLKRFNLSSGENRELLNCINPTPLKLNEWIELPELPILAQIITQPA